MVNQELTNRKVMEEAQKLESNYGIENMIIEILLLTSFSMFY
jgi:hypothetical protein